MASKKLHPVEEYARKVIAKKILACRWVRLACERHIRDLRKYGTKPSRIIWFDKKSAQDAIDFFPKFLVFYEGDFDGKPFELELWQKFIIGSIFGWKRGDYRRFRTAYIEIAKGNGKSPMAAGIGLFGLIADSEPGAEIYAAATMREQAGILFRDAKAFVDGSPSLSKKLNVGVGNISYEGTNSFFRPVSSEHRGLDGKRPHIALIDEIHEHPNAMVVNKMRAGTKGRRQALIFEITNAGYNRHSICFQHHEYTEKICEGIFENDAWFGFMTGLDVCDKCAAEGKTIPVDNCPNCDFWQDEKVWIKANPNLGVSIQKSYIKEQVDEATKMPSNENIVKRLNFCIWTESVTRWITIEAWNICAESDLNLVNFIGQPCYMAFDLANKIDISALIMVFIREDELVVFGRYYLPEDTIKRSKIQQYERWVKENRIIQTPGAMTDYQYIENDIKKINENHPILELAYDPHEATYLVNNIMEWLESDPKDPKICISINQGPAQISEPMKQLEGLVYNKKIHHNGDPVLTWMVSNVVKREGRGSTPIKYYYPTKTSEDNKIDGAVAMIMGIGRAMLKTETKSAYDGMTAEQIKERMMG